MFLNSMTGNTQAKVRVERKARGSKSGPPSGSGPVIDV
jgi:hypothetical protein